MNLPYVQFLIVVFLSCSFAQRNRSKNCTTDKFDENVANLFAQFGLDELKFPTNNRELGDYCEGAKSSNEYAKNYGQNCLKGTSQTLMSLAVYNFDRTNKQYCAKNAKLKDKFTSWGKCGNAGKTGTKKCWDSMILIMANVRKVKNSKSKIPIICCNYYEWVRCTLKALKDTGSVCPQSAIDGYDQHIHKATVDSMNLICRKFEDNIEKCASLYEQLPKTKPKSLRKLPLLYVFDVFDSL